MCLPSIRHQFSLLNCLAILLFGVLSSVLLAGSAVGQIQNSTAVRRLEQFRERLSEILLNLRH